MHHLSVIAVLLVSACAAESDLLTAPAQDTGFADADGATGGGDPVVPDAPVPDYIALSGLLSVVEGVPTTTSTVTLTWRAGADPICADLLEVVGVTTPAGPPNALAWWGLDLAAAADVGSPEGSCGYPVPAHLSLGFAPYDETLSPAADASGVADQSAQLYALMLQYDGDAQEAFVFGVAGTADQFAGLGAAAATGPVPDGDYELESLYLLPLPPSSAR